MPAKIFHSTLTGLPLAFGLALLLAVSPARADPEASGQGHGASSPPAIHQGHKIVRETGNSCRTATPWCIVRFASDVTAGNILILFVDTMTSKGINSVTDTCNSTWRREDSLIGSQFFHAFSTTAACSGPETITVNTNGSPDTEFQVLEVAGLTQTLDGIPVRNPATSVNTSDNPACEAITTTNPSDLVLCAVGCQTPVPVIAGPSDDGPDASQWVESVADQKTVDTTIVAHEDESAVGSYGAQYRLGDISSWTAITIAYKDSPATVTLPPAPIATNTPAPEH